MNAKVIVLLIGTNDIYYVDDLFGASAQQFLPPWKPNTGGC